MILEPVHYLVPTRARYDDIVTGTDAIMRMLCGTAPRMRVTALVLAGAGAVRENEERAVLAELCVEASLDVRVAGFPDNRLPAHWGEMKQAVVALHETGEPDLVIGPQQGDAHQDHRLVAELLTQTFRRQLVQGYEITEYESDLSTPATFVLVSDEVTRLKADVIARRYPSQVEGHPWFNAEAFTALMRLHGTQCNHRYVEAFVMPTTTVKIGIPA